MKIRTACVIALLIGLLHLPLALPVTQAMGFARQAPTPQQQPMITLRETRGTLFENVVAVLQKRYYDERFRKEELPKLVTQYTDKASRAKKPGEQRELVQDLLSHIPASHLGLLSKQTFRYVWDDLQGLAYPTFGFQLTAIKGKFYAVMLLEGGPALRAGLLSWDRIVTIDGLAVEQSPRLDWRSDDAYLGDDRDPPMHHLIASQGDVIRLKVERQPKKFIEIKVPAATYSAFAAARASAQIFKKSGRTIGYLHFWFVHMTGVPELLKEKLEGEFGACDAVVIDLRGRGGNGAVVARLVDIVRADRAAKNRPFVALMDRQSRSAKDVLAYEFKQKGLARLVGERSAGAVIPATFADVGHEMILMFPSFKLPRYTDLLEFKPVEPDVFVERAGPLSAGDDPILTAGLAEALRLVQAAKSASVK